MIGPERSSGNSDGAGVPTAPEGDCDSDGIKNAVDADDDNDLLDDGTELKLKLDPCVGDTDGDSVEDGYEYKSALDLNNDDYQEPNVVTPFPHKTQYPNPLFADADVDYDGDGLTLVTEQALWLYTYQTNGTATRTLSPLSYSDGMQFSLSELQGGDGRRVPTMHVSNYQPPLNFRAWADGKGYGTPQLFALAAPPAHTTSGFDLFDMDRSGGAPSVNERYYWNESDEFVSDDERDEDADGLTNYHEAIGPMSAEWWKSCYTAEGAFPIVYAGTKAFDADSDGDGVLDGADDQDFDDVPNVMELSRSLAGNVADQGECGTTPQVEAVDPDGTAWVNPFNPCLPDRYSRTCSRHPGFGAAYPPFQQQWKKYALN